MNNNRISHGASIFLVAVAMLALTATCTTSQQEQGTPAVDSKRMTQLLAQADSLYAQRSDLNRVREAIALLYSSKASGYEVAWRLSQFNYYLGDNSPDQSEREQAFNYGILTGKAAVASDPEKPEGHFWLGANMGGQAQMKGPLSGLKYVSDIRREMETVIKLDERYMGGSAYMALGQIDLDLPGFLGGDSKRAVEYLEKGVQVDDENHRMRLLLAKAYLSVGRKEDARRQLLTLLEIPKDPEHSPEYNKTVEEARQMLDKRF
jgi:predicted Zn-dependent protease